MTSLAVLGLATATLAQVHPLDPLSKTELAAAARVVVASREFPKGALFPMIALREPPKEEVLAWTQGAPFRREALAIVLDRARNTTHEAVVDLRAGKLVSWTPRPGAQPLVLVEEYDKVAQIVKADAGWQSAMRARGITDFRKVWVDTWATGLFAPKGHESARLLRGVSYLQDGALNFYGRPIEGVTAVVDLNAEKVVELVDTGVVPIAAEAPQFDERSIGPQRKGVRPLVIRQPKGASFERAGQEVRWQSWRFRWALHPREGLVLYTVGYEDAGAVRSILYRGGLSEMVVPYGDADANWVWRNAFDEGEYGVGRLASPLEPQRDAPPNAVFFDADFVDDFGKPYVLPRAVGLYERDAGILWKHYDVYKNVNQTRRARELVIFFVATIGNYDYAIHYVFHQDGTLEVDAALTGIMLARGVKDDAHGHHGHLVAKNIVAPHHQHFFNFRLDLDVDGQSNSVFEMNIRAAPAGAANPHHNAIVMEDTPLQREGVAGRDVSMREARKWRVVNGARKTALGYNPGYLLAPGETSVPYLAKESLVRQRAGFVEHHFWATRYKSGENYGAGDYPNQGKVGGGLTRFVADDEPLDGQDLVVWYTFGVTHVPRPEEWPIMTVHHVGFKLLPAGFFAKNPALDVPR